MTLDELRRDLGDAAFDDLHAGIVCEAEHDANLFADKLDAGNVNSKTAKGKGRSSLGPQHHAVLALAVMLPRLERWYANGDDRIFEKRPPSPTVVVESIRRAVQNSFDKESVELCRRLSVEVLVCWMQNCSWSARRTIGAEVTLRQPSSVLANMEALAVFLRRHHPLAETERGEQNADS